MLRGFLVFLFITFLFPAPILAQNNIEIVDLPESVAIEEEFELSVEIAMPASSTYYIKARAGAALNSMRMALTYNSSTKTWLGDTSAWLGFPVISTDENGFWSGNLKVKIKEGSQTGLNLILISLRKVSTGKKSNSATVEFILVKNTTKNSATNNSSDKNLKVILNEFSPAPEGNREWVEIYNPNSSTVDLTGWQIDDIPKGSSPFKIPDKTKIISKGYKVFYFSSKLNNSGDTLRLINSNGKVLEKFSYGKVEKDTVFAKDSKGAWKSTTTPTPGKENKITGQSVSSSKSSNALNDSVSGLTSEAQEVISTLPEILGIENPSSFSDASDTRPIQAEFAQTTNTNPQSSIPIILIGFGIILIGIAFGIPSLKQQSIRKHETTHN